MCHAWRLFAVVAPNTLPTPQFNGLIYTARKGESGLDKTCVVTFSGKTRQIVLARNNPWETRNFPFHIFSTHQSLISNIFVRQPNILSSSCCSLSRLLREQPRSDTRWPTGRVAAVVSVTPSDGKYHAAATLTALSVRSHRSSATLSRYR